MKMIHTSLVVFEDFIVLLFDIEEMTTRYSSLLSV